MVTLGSGLLFKKKKRVLGVQGISQHQPSEFFNVFHCADNPLNAA